MPIPLMRDRKGWYFDTAEGIQEIRWRRIGAGELEAIAGCRVYVRAQGGVRAAQSGRVRMEAHQHRGQEGPLLLAVDWKAYESPLGPVAVAAEGATGARPHGTWRGYHFHASSPSREAPRREGRGATSPTVA